MEFYVHLRSCAIACAGSFGGAAVGREWFNGSCFGLLAMSVEAQLWLCALISHFLHIIYLAFKKVNNFHLLLLVLCNLQQKWQVKFITLRGRHKNRSQSSKRKGSRVQKSGVCWTPIHILRSIIYLCQSSVISIYKNITFVVLSKCRIKAFFLANANWEETEILPYYIYYISLQYLVFLGKH